MNPLVIRLLLAGLAFTACSTGTAHRDTVEDTHPEDVDGDDTSGDAEIVDPFDPIWEGPVEWAVQPSVARPTDGGPCGVRPDGTYEGPCELRLADDWVSSLCDEARKTCVAPIEDCRGGWCYVPPRSYLAGGSLDVTWWGAIRIAVMPRGFYVMQTEVTLDTFERLMGFLPDSGVSCGPDCPAAGVTAFEAMELANRLSDLHGLERCHVLKGCRFVDVPWPNPAGPDTRAWMCESATRIVTATASPRHERPNSLSGPGARSVWGADRSTSARTASPETLSPTPNNTSSSAATRARQQTPVRSSAANAAQSLARVGRPRTSAPTKPYA